MRDRQLLDRALIALEQGEEADPSLIACLIEDLRDRLFMAEPTAAPVAWMDSEGFPWSEQGLKCRTTPDTYEPLYLSPKNKEFITLTDKDISDCWTHRPDTRGVFDLYLFARAVESKLKEKNIG